MRVADKEIILRQQPDEIEPELPGCGLDAETGVRHAAGDIGGDRAWVNSICCAPLILASSILVQGQQLVEQQARAGIMVAVDEARLAVDRSSSEVILSGLPRLTHQSHLARDETDDPVLARIEPFLAGLNALRAQRRHAADARRRGRRRPAPATPANSGC